MSNIVNINENIVNTNENIVNTNENIVNTNENIENMNDKDISIEGSINLSKDDVTNFKIQAKKYFDIDDQIKLLQKNLNEKKKLRKQYSNEIILFMEKFNIDNLNTNNGKLKYYTSLEKKKLNKENLKLKLNEFFKNSDKALDCFKYLNNREKIERKRLKRFKN